MLGAREPVNKASQARLIYGLLLLTAPTAVDRGSTQFDLPAGGHWNRSYAFTSRFPRAHKRSQTTMSSPETGGDRKRARRAWTGECRTCGARFSGDGA